MKAIYLRFKNAIGITPFGISEATILSANQKVSSNTTIKTRVYWDFLKNTLKSYDNALA